MDANKISQFLITTRDKVKELNSRRDPSTNVFIAVALVFFGGFMLYNFIGSQLTQVASKSYSPTAITPIPTVVTTTTPSPSPAQYFYGE